MTDNKELKAAKADTKETAMLGLFGVGLGLIGIAATAAFSLSREVEQKEELQKAFSKAKIDIVDSQKTMAMDGVKVEQTAKDTLYTLTAADLRGLGMTPPGPKPQ